MRRQRRTFADAVERAAETLTDRFGERLEIALQGDGTNLVAIEREEHGLADGRIPKQPVDRELHVLPRPPKLLFQ
jgi:hypothetical protein